MKTRHKRLVDEFRSQEIEILLMEKKLIRKVYDIFMLESRKEKINIVTAAYRDQMQLNLITMRKKMAGGRCLERQNRQH